MERNLEFLHMWFYFKFLHMTDVEKFEISFIVCSIYGILLHFTQFCNNILLFFGDLRCFVAKSILRFTHFCEEKNLAKNSARGEKITNMRYAPNTLESLTLTILTFITDHNKGNHLFMTEKIRIINRQINTRMAEKLSHLNKESKCPNCTEV